MTVLTVGLTGGIASGKTVVAKIFTELGAPLIDADDVARAVVQPPSPALERIRAEFGERFLLADGSLNRALMRAHVFADAAERRRLEQILHPLIAARLEQWRDARTEPYCLLSAAILLESGMQRLTDRILVVDVPEQVQQSRLVVRDGIDETLAHGMLAAQLPRAARLQAAHDVIDNAGALEETRAQVRRLHELYLRLARDRVSVSAAPELK